MKNTLPLVVLFVWLSAITTVLIWFFLAKTPVTLPYQQTAVQSAPETIEETAQLESQLASLSSRVQSIEQALQMSPKPTAAPSQAAVPSLPAREYYVPLGSGSTTNRDWTTLTGVGVYFDPSKYQPIKNIYFEAAGSIVSGEVHVVLVDVTNNVTFWQGELIFNTSNPTWEQSVPLTLSTAPSQLQVQIQSSNGEQAVLNDSRLLIQTGY